MGRNTVVHKLSAKARPIMSTFVRNRWQTYATYYLMGIILLSKFTY